MRRSTYVKKKEKLVEEDLDREEGEAVLCVRDQLGGNRVDWVNPSATVPAVDGSSSSCSSSSSSSSCVAVVPRHEARQPPAEALETISSKRAAPAIALPLVGQVCSRSEEEHHRPPARCSPNIENRALPPHPPEGADEEEEQQRRRCALSAP